MDNIGDIVNKSLPINKVIDYYKEVKGASKDIVLGYVTFTDSAKKVSITLIKGSEVPVHVFMNLLYSSIS